MTYSHPLGTARALLFTRSRRWHPGHGICRAYRLAICGTYDGMWRSEKPDRRGAATGAGAAGVLRVVVWEPSGVPERELYLRVVYLRVVYGLAMGAAAGGGGCVGMGGAGADGGVVRVVTARKLERAREA